jgi:hypothetical protein
MVCAAHEDKELCEAPQEAALVRLPKRLGRGGCEGAVGRALGEEEVKPSNVAGEETFGIGWGMRDQTLRQGLELKTWKKTKRGLGRMWPCDSRAGCLGGDWCSRSSVTTQREEAACSGRIPALA